MLARDPQSWLDYLAGRGVTHLRLHYSHTSQQASPDRSAAAFAGGGGYWFIETVRPPDSDLWESVWETRSKRGPRIWKVWYVLSRVRPDEIRDISSTQEGARKELHDALTDIISFAEKHDDTKQWVSWFQKALAALDTEDDEYSRSILPETCYTKDARQLIAASTSAWLFGGMGSWNDVSFLDSEGIMKEYSRVSDRLYDAICTAIVSAVNSYP